MRTSYESHVAFLSTLVIGATLSAPAMAKPNGYIGDVWTGSVTCDTTTEWISESTEDACQEALDARVDFYETAMESEVLIPCEELTVEECSGRYTWVDANGDIHTSGSTVMVKIGVAGGKPAFDPTSMGGPTSFSSATLLQQHELQPAFETVCDELRWKAERRCGETIVEKAASCEDSNANPTESCLNALEVLQDTCWAPCPFRAMERLDLPLNVREPFTPGKVQGGDTLKDTHNIDLPRHK